jgi:glyoxylase-like metal-dependent hydrolase (beta-lactamase superfamily II)
MVKRLIFCFALFCLPMGILAEESYKITEVVDGVYVAIRPGVLKYPIEGNISIIVNEHDVIVVDSPRTPSNARVVLKEIRKLTDKPVRYLINTHWHGDHHHGNFVFQQAYPGLEILSSEPARKEIATRGKRSLEGQIEAFTDRENVEDLATDTTDSRGEPLSGPMIYRYRRLAETALEYGRELKEVVLTLPTLTFEGRTNLYRGDREIQIFNNGYGNTAGDTMIYFPKEKVLITGDLLISTVPFMYSSRPRGWLARLREIEKIDFEVIVPGHGEIQRDRHYLELHIRLLESLLKQVDESIANGLTLEQTIEQVDLAEFRRTYAQGDEAAGYEFDLRITLSAIRDAYNEKAQKK